MYVVTKLTRVEVKFLMVRTYRQPRPQGAFIFFRSLSFNFFILDVTCITEDCGLKAVCLNKDVLRTALVSLYDRECAYLPPQDNIPNRSLRYAAYRQFTWWVQVKLGRHVRRIIPSCAVSAIRKAFPENDNNYSGFKGDDNSLHHLSEVICAWEWDEEKAMSDSE